MSIIRYLASIFKDPVATDQSPESPDGTFNVMKNAVKADSNAKAPWEEAAEKIRANKAALKKAEEAEAKASSGTF